MGLESHGIRIPGLGTGIETDSLGTGTNIAGTKISGTAESKEIALIVFINQ